MIVRCSQLCFIQPTTLILSGKIQHLQGLYTERFLSPPGIKVICTKKVHVITPYPWMLKQGLALDQRPVHELSIFWSDGIDNEGEIYQVDWDQSDNVLVGAAQPRFQLPPVNPQGTTADRSCLIKVSRPCLQ